ncbi:MAG: hypothetical protein HYX93_02780 [Chloroflexi bacterium]|nr:hypothetical protein [Chloroflexota bacterium]
METLAATLAQELESPLQAILNVAHIMAQDAQGEGVSGEDVERVKTAALRASNVVRALLEIAYSHEHRWEVHEINTLVSDAVSASGLLTATAVVVSMQLDPSSPKIRCNGDQMKHVFLNLITNAWDAMPKEGHLTISTRVVGDRVEIKFTDTGVGIPPEHLDRVFDPLFTTKGGTQGTGLGLASGRDIVRRHGGSISAESRIGSGTTFIILLPLAGPQL